MLIKISTRLLFQIIDPTKGRFKGVDLHFELILVGISWKFSWNTPVILRLLGNELESKPPAQFNPPNKILKFKISGNNIM